MPHIHTGDNQHDLTVTAYVVRTDAEEPKILLHMHRKLNVLLPIGGHVELNETPWQAIAHELTEESGYMLEQLEILQPKSRIEGLNDAILHPYPLLINTHDITPNHFHTDIGYVFVTSEEPGVAIDDGESLDLRWLSSADISALPLPMTRENTRQTCDFIFNEVLDEWDRVPTNSFKQ